MAIAYGVGDTFGATAGIIVLAVVVIWCVFMVFFNK